MVSGCDNKPIETARTEHRCIVSRTWTKTHPGLRDRQLLNPRDSAPCTFEQRKQAPGRQRIIEAALLNCLADDEPPVLTRHQIPARQPNDVAQQRCGGIHTQSEHLPLYRPNRRKMSRWNTRDLARPSTCGQDDNLGWVTAAIRDDGERPSACNLHFSNRFVLVQLDTGMARRASEGGGKAAVLDLMISRAEDGSGDPRAQMRLAAPCFRPGKPFDLQAKAFLKIVAVP